MDLKPPESPPIVTRYPLAPLLSVLGIEPAPSGSSKNDPTLYTSVIAERLGVTTRTIWRWKADGIPALQCDRLACHIANMHPLNIWPDWEPFTRKGTNQ